MQLKGGYKGVKKTVSSSNQTLLDTTLPTELDWRTKNVLNKPKDQQQCGSCWAFSTVGTLESRWAIKTGKLLSLSEQELVDCDSTDGGCDGGLMDNAFTWLKDNKLESEEEYPYKATGGSCGYKAADGLVGTSGFKDLEQTEDALLAELQNGPVAVAVAAND